MNVILDSLSNLVSTPPPLAKVFLQYIFLVEAGIVPLASEDGSIYMPPQC